MSNPGPVSGGIDINTPEGLVTVTEASNPASVTIAFHPDGQETPWSYVLSALDPAQKPQPVANYNTGWSIVLKEGAETVATRTFWTTLGA